MARATASFFDELCAESADFHAGSLAHPVVQGIGAGTLPLAGFRAYLAQDYQFLLRYARVLARAVAAAPDRATMARLAELLHGTLAVEVDALRALYARCDGDPATLDTVELAPVCRGYTDHLLAVSSDERLLATLAAILPCQWGYRELGRALAARGMPDEPRYAAWISEYASDEYGALVDWLVARFEELSDDANDAEREQARAAFRASSAWELAFWDTGSVTS
jgi:thiaminase/transcriptional activator TenA